jgi:hypothetical protein
MTRMLITQFTSGALRALADVPIVCPSATGLSTNTPRHVIEGCRP